MYLEQFYNRIRKKWKGSLVKVKDIREEEPNAKEYLNKLAKAGLIEKVKWGWYWIPDEVEDIWEFLKKDKNFKVISSQTAASFWNHDFIHRDIYVIKVDNKSYQKALEAFARAKGWNLKVEYETRKMHYIKIGGLFVEDIEETIINCLQNWAFVDAFAVLYANRERIRLEKLAEKGYWKRIAGSDVRVRQALEYGYSLMDLRKSKNISLSDDYVRVEIEEAVEKVIRLG